MKRTTCTSTQSDSDESVKVVSASWQLDPDSITSTQSTGMAHSHRIWRLTSRDSRRNTDETLYLSALRASFLPHTIGASHRLVWLQSAVSQRRPQRHLFLPCASLCCVHHLQLVALKHRAHVSSSRYHLQQDCHHSTSVQGIAGFERTVPFHPVSVGSIVISVSRPLLCVPQVETALILVSGIQEPIIGYQCSLYISLGGLLLQTSSNFAFNAL